MKTVNLFVDCHVFDGNLQGTTTYLKGLYQELINDKSKNFFLAAHNIENLQSIFGIHENVIYLQYSSKNKFVRLLFDIPKLIRQNKIDYAHFQYIVPPTKSCKYIVTIHDVLFLDFPQYFPLFYRIKNKLFFKYSANKSDIVLTVSQYSKEKIEKHIKEIEPKILSELRLGFPPGFGPFHPKEKKRNGQQHQKIVVPPRAALKGDFLP